MITLCILLLLAIFIFWGFADNAVVALCGVGIAAVLVARFLP